MHFSSAGKKLWVNDGESGHQGAKLRVRAALLGRFTTSDQRGGPRSGEGLAVAALGLLEAQRPLFWQHAAIYYLAGMNKSEQRF